MLRYKTSISVRNCGKQHEEKESLTPRAGIKLVYTETCIWLQHLPSRTSLSCSVISDASYWNKNSANKLCAWKPFAGLSINGFPNVFLKLTTWLQLLTLKSMTGKKNNEQQQQQKTSWKAKFVKTNFPMMAWQGC